MSLIGVGPAVLRYSGRLEAPSTNPQAVTPVIDQLQYRDWEISVTLRPSEPRSGNERLGIFVLYPTEINGETQWDVMVPGNEVARVNATSQVTVSEPIRVTGRNYRLGVRTIPDLGGGFSLDVEIWGSKLIALDESGTGQYRVSPAQSIYAGRAPSPVIDQPNLRYYELSISLYSATHDWYWVQVAYENVLGQFDNPHPSNATYVVYFPGWGPITVGEPIRLLGRRFRVYAEAFNATVDGQKHKPYIQLWASKLEPFS